MVCVRHTVSKIVHYLTRPFGEEFPFFMLVLLLASLPAMFFICTPIAWLHALYVFLASLCISYMMALSAAILPDKLARVIRIVFVALIGIDLVLNLFCIIKFQIFLNADFIGALLGTNPNEATEFLDTFVDFKTVTILALSFIGCGWLALMSKRVKLSANAQRVCLALVCMSAAVLSFSNNAVFKSSNIIGHLYFALSAEKTPDLREYYTSPDLQKITSKQPQNIVMVIGESFSKYHSSLYGYEKKTNPRLSALRDSSLLYTVEALASACQTIPAFKRFMTTHHNAKEEEWYKSTTIPEIVSLCGYESYWISNQSKHGWYDNVVGKFADLCDYQFFVGEKFGGLNGKTFDEDVLPAVEKVSKKKNRGGKRKNFYFIHLMGSHSAFESRYPTDRNHFKESEYAKYPMKQCKNRAAYDNSILYNDSVVNEIIKRFEDKETIIIYFSDHALDFYQTSNDYCEHAKASPPISESYGKAIPFMVYASREYQRNFPEMMRKIKLCGDKKFSTDNLIYTVMDIIGVKFAKNDDVEHFSLFR